MKKEVANLRRNYTKHHLLDAECEENAIDQFKNWFDDAIKGEILEPNAMILSTVADNKPKSRVLLLKDFGPRGFSFYTNYHSNKGKQLAENPNACMTFFWDKLERQIRIEGEIEKLSPKESDQYFHSRPRGSQIGAWVSNQSEEIENRGVLDQQLLDFQAKFENQELIPRPPHWGGYLLKPSSIEFWQGRPSRLHDRLKYTLMDGNWVISRLSP